MSPKDGGGQPAGASDPRARVDYPTEGLEFVLAFLKQARYDFRALRFVRVWPDQLQVFDVNGDSFVIGGLGYLSPDVTVVLDSINAVYRPEAIHEPTDQPFKQFKTGRRYPWAADRVM
jgi:hypothetical protein